MSIYLNLVVIRSVNIEQSVIFYQTLGLIFKKERHGDGQEHYACEIGNLIFEIYPSQSEFVDETTRIGFNVKNLDGLIEKISQNDGLIITEPTLSPWGKRAVIKDPDGHKVELLEPLKK